MKIFLTLLILLTAPALTSYAADYSAEIAATETYLNTLKTGKARFVQTTHDGVQLVGTFYLSRPGKLRFEYDDPIEDFVVSDGVFLYFYDSELGQQSNIPVGQTLADFFLREDVTIGKDVVVADVQRGGDLLQIKLVQKNDPENGSLTLGLRENPMALKKWRVTDPQGLITEVELFYLKTDIDLDDSLFVYRDPKEVKGRLND